MAYPKAAFDYASNILNSRRIRAELELDARRNEAFAHFPELSALDREEADAGYNAAVNGGGAAGLKNTLEHIAGKRRKVLRDAGLSLDLLEPKYSCPMCGDTGYINGERCRCLDALLRKFMRERVNAASALRLCRFGDFSLDFYSRDVDAELSRSPREVMSEIFDYCRAYADSFTLSSPSLLMIGDPGLGKTHLALAIADRVLERGHDVIYCSAQTIFSSIEEDRRAFRLSDTLAAITGCDLLILDDLGTEYLSPFVLSTMYELINTRMMLRRPTIYTSNITEQPLLVSRYTDKISSRLIGECKILYFVGDDIRLKRREF